MADLGAFSRYKNFNDYQAEAEKQGLAKALAGAQIQRYQAAAANSAGGGNLPAPLKLANEYQSRIDSGDIEGANQILMFAKAADKGLITDSLGRFQSAPGYAPAIAGIEGAKAGAKEQGKKSVQLRMDPIIKKEVKIAEAVGGDIGDEVVSYGSALARMPQLEDTAKRLSALGKNATYTYAGQARDAAIRQTGGDVPPAAVARAEYISMVDNEILPLLRQTFGAQFTQKEGESLKITLGDPNKSPKEKDAVLRSFIRTKMESLNTSARKLGRDLPYQGLNQPKDQSVSNGTPIVKTQAQFDALPPGSVYMEIGEDGKPTPHRKP